MRKNIGDLFSVIRRLLRSKRALYLVNTSEEFLFFNRSNGVVVVSQAILHANNQFHSIVCIFYTQTCFIVTETIIFINLFFIFNLSNEDRPSYKFWNKSNGLEMNMAFRIVPGYFLGSFSSNPDYIASIGIEIVSSKIIANILLCCPIRQLIQLIIFQSCGYDRWQEVASLPK